MKTNYAVYEIYDEHIDGLLALRTRILSKDATASVDEIDAILSTVERNDVDLTLGRPGAVLPDYYTSAAELEATRQDWYAIRGDTDL